MPNYNVTFRFNLPIRPDVTVQVSGGDEEEVSENAHKEAERKGVIFGQYAYNEVPQNVELIKETV